jgi:hypothetical protein
VRKCSIPTFLSELSILQLLSSTPVYPPACDMRDMRVSSVLHCLLAGMAWCTGTSSLRTSCLVRPLCSWLQQAVQQQCSRSQTLGCQHSTHQERYVKQFGETMMLVSACFCVCLTDDACYGDGMCFACDLHSAESWVAVLMGCLHDVLAHA